MPDAFTADAAGVEEATLERRTFRQIVVGHLVHPPERLTWIFLRGATRARLQLACQRGTPPKGRFGISLSGAEKDEAMWGPPLLTDYVGPRVHESPLSYRLAVASGAVGETECERVPSVLLLTCRPDQATVLHAGAALVTGRKGPRDEVPWHWQPPTTERVPVLRCDLAEEGKTDGLARPFRLLWPDWPSPSPPKGGAPPGSSGPMRTRTVSCKRAPTAGCRRFRRPRRRRGAPDRAWARRRRCDEALAERAHRASGRTPGSR